MRGRAHGVPEHCPLPARSRGQSTFTFPSLINFAHLTFSARLIHKAYEVDPLACPKCGTQMHVIALIDDATVIRRILEHLRRWAPRHARKNQRAPPADGKGIDGLELPVREWTYHPVPDIA